MTTNERIKEIAEKHYRNFLRDIGLDSLSDEATDVYHAIEQAILESTKDLTATIESQRKEIEELMKDKERLDFITTHSFDCRELNYISMPREVIDSAISKQKE